MVQLDDKGQVHELRSGRNAMVCIADRPNDDLFDVRCYQKDFVRVVLRTLQLRRIGRGDRFTNLSPPVEDIVADEIKNGTLPLSNTPTAGYRCEGPIGDFDAARNVTGPGIECWESVHFPFRTAKEIGLVDESEISEEQAMSVPYVMSSGSYWAHVMIRHPRK